ncbi:hypothetical protein AA637_09650 [Cyanobacterium sp. HL-69]|uniref:Rpn family recombination-promoting nuclease/putative transposase n=1 Tax=Cyanobacterium sp. HL-69 TaxID=2054282 RepID=UPI000CA3DBF7|nr:hypothetical protein AA637_09650 [Cyanobacterium sp. HL-69]
MKTDSIFYELFLNLPDSLFSLLGLSPQLAKEYQFTSQELKQLAKRIDGLFLPLNDDKPIYFVEVQFQKDDSLYHRLFTEIFTYLGQYKPPQNFCAVVMWAKKSLDISLPPYYQEFQDSGKLTVIYLDELNSNTTDSIGVEIMKLIIAPQSQAKTQVEKLFSIAQKADNSTTKNQDIIELLEKILTYKFSNYSREELARMFTLSDFKKTRFYQETYAEGKIDAKISSIPNLLKLGLTAEQIAQALELDIELVKKIAGNEQN